MAKKGGKSTRREFLYLVAAGVGVAAALQTERFRPTPGDIQIIPGGGPRGDVTPTGTATPTPVPAGPDLVVDPGEVHSVAAGNDVQNENYRHALVGGTVQNGGTIQTDGTDS